MDKNEVLKILETAKDKNGEVPMRLVRQAFEKLPESCEDTISRRAAIEWCRPEDWGTPDERWRPESEYGAMIEALPSAQPEIVRCKDCKFTDGEKPIADGRYWCVLHSSFMYFCSDAERRGG